MKFAGGARDYRYVYFAHNSNNAPGLSRKGTGTPKTNIAIARPGSAPVINLSWEIIVPEILSGNAVNWNITYGIPGNQDELPLLEWRRGMDGLGAFTKHGLLIKGVDILMSDTTHITDGVQPNGTTSVTTELLVDNPAGGAKLVVFSSAAWPATGGATNTIQKVTMAPHATNVGVLGEFAPQAYLRLFNDPPGDLAAGRIRVQMQVVEI